MPVRQAGHRAAPATSASGDRLERARRAPAAAGPPARAGGPAAPPRRACSTRRSRGSARATWGSRARTAEQRRRWRSGPSTEAKGARWTASPPAARALQSVRPRGCIGRSWICSTSPGERRVPGRRHRDQRPRRRPLRADRGRRRAGRRRRAARHLRLAGADGAAAVARDPALHRHHQAMVDSAPAPAEVLPSWRELLEAGCWWPTTRASTAACCAQAFERCGLDWPDPPVLCTVALARRFAPLVAPARAGAAGRLARHRGRRGPPRAARRPHLRARALRAVPAAVRQRGHGRRRAGGCSGRAAGAPQDRARRADPARPSGRTCPRSPTTRACTSSATSAAGRCTWASRCRCASRARAHFCAPAGWTERAEIVDYRPTNSELGALVLENRLIKQWQPAGQQEAQAHRPLRATCAAGSTSPTRCSRWPPSPRPGHAVNVGPARRPHARAASWPTSSPRCTGCATAGAGCSCASTRRSTGRWAAAPRPAWATSTRTPTARQVDLALALFERPGAGDGAARARSTGGCAEASRRPALRARRGAAAPARAAGWAARAAGGRAARRSTPRPGWCWPATPSRSASTRSGWCAAGWSTGGRCPGTRELAERTEAALRAPAARAARRCRPTRSTRCGSSPAGWPTASPPELPLDPAPGAAALLRLRRLALLGAAAPRSTARLEWVCVAERLASERRRSGRARGVSLVADVVLVAVGSISADGTGDLEAVVPALISTCFVGSCTIYQRASRAAPASDRVAGVDRRLRASSQMRPFAARWRSATGCSAT